MRVLLDDAGRLAGATTAARAYAAEWSFVRVAEEVRRVILADTAARH
jgi:cysteine synthase